MNTKVFKSVLCAFFSLLVVLLSGCERTQDMGITDEMITPPDADPMPTLKVGLIRHSDYIDFAQGAELAQQQINAAGGVLGRQLEFVVKEEITDTVAQTAIDFAEMGDVVAIIGPPVFKPCREGRSRCHHSSTCGGNRQRCDGNG